MQIKCNQEVYDSLKSLCEFAYEQGFHELGYDPVEVVVANAKRYLWLKAHHDTTPNLWRLLAKGGPENSSESFDTMVDRIMASEAAAFERGKTTALQRD